MSADFLLERSHGFYSCKPQTDKAREFVANRPKDWPLSYERDEFLLDSFFANAGDWCRRVLLPAGFSLQWGTHVYSGNAGIEELWETCK
jgi:hypothetical protein